MAAGQGFKTFTTGEVLTASDVNGYLMQGILVFASSAARSASVTSPQEGQYSYLKDTNALEYYDGAAWVGAPVGDITAVTAGTGLSGGGASGDVTLTNTMATAIDAKGDLVAGTGADAFSRLAVGANDTVLTADSTAATGLKWAVPAAGGMTLLSTTTLTGASVTISSISGSYTNLVYYVANYRPVNNATSLILRLNGDSTTNYRTIDWAPLSGAAWAQTYCLVSGAWNGNTTPMVGLIYGEIPYYSNTSTWKYHRVTGISSETTTTAAFNAYHAAFGSTSAITSLTFSPFSGNFTSGTVYLYGVK